MLPLSLVSPSPLSLFPSSLMLVSARSAVLCDSCLSMTIVVCLLLASYTHSSNARLCRSRNTFYHLSCHFHIVFHCCSHLLSIHSLCLSDLHVVHHCPFLLSIHCSFLLDI